MSEREGRKIDLLTVGESSATMATKSQTTHLRRKYTGEWRAWRSVRRSVTSLPGSTRGVPKPSAPHDGSGGNDPRALREVR